ncbi:putative reverse transcriptase domain-containing protein [Tanacetum coccineum]
MWLYHTLNAAPIVDILCIFNHRQREEALIDQHEELSNSNELYDLEAQVEVELNSEVYHEKMQIDEELSSEPYDEESQAVHQEGVELRWVFVTYKPYTSIFLFGVGVPSGVEAVLHGANRFLNKFHSDGSLAMLTVDFSNAFNLVDRTTLLHEVRTRCPSISLWVDFLYGQSARLYVGDDHIWSTTGVQQGDPLGPLLFALVLHPLVHRIRDCCQLLFHAWYLDDGTIIGDTKEVAKAIDIIRAEGPRLGLELNIKKTEVFWPSCNGVKVKDGLFPRDIGRPTLGVKLLGGAVSRDAGFISSLAVKRASRAVELMSLLPRLRDPQSELLLLRSCMGVAKLLFGLRTCQPMYIGEAVSIFDNGLRRAIEAIVVCGGPFLRMLMRLKS